MKKRWFAIVLTLCLTLAMMTVTAEAAVFYDRVHADNGRTITFTVGATYRCENGGVSTPVTEAGAYEVQNVNSWTPDEIELQIKVSYVYCQGEGPSHGSHKNTAIATPSRTVTLTGDDLCHKKLDLTATIEDIQSDNWGDALTFTVTTDAPRYTLIKHEKADATCTEYGYTQLCYECRGCGKFFEDEDAKQSLEASQVLIPMTSHKYDEHGVCADCKNEAEAYISISGGGNTYYATVEDALEVAYGDSNNMSVWIVRYAREDVITLTNSCRVFVCENVTIPEIRVSAPDLSTAFDITNRGGTIGKISCSEITSGNSVTATISNDNGSSGTKGSIGTITPANSGEQNLDIRNWGTMTQINIPDNKSLRMEITNNTGAEINTIQSGSTATVEGMYVTIQNNGTIKQLYGKKPIQLLSGIGEYVWITTANTGSKLGELLGAGCKLYQGNVWYGAECSLQGATYFTVSEPPFSVTVTGPAGFQSDESGGYSLTLAKDAVQDQKLSTSLSYPNANTSLSSEGVGITYGWYYTGADTAKWPTAELPLNELAVGVHHLTLRVTDSKYNYTHSINVTVTIASENAEQLSLTVSGPCTKVYDGTTDVPENLTIEFVDSKGRTVPLAVNADYEVITAAYNSPNCKDAATITVQVALTEEAQKKYFLSADQFTADGTITKFKVEGNSRFFYLAVKNTKANVGDHIMDHLTAENVNFTYSKSLYPNVPDPMDAYPDITYYRMRTEGVYDPTTDEKLTENSIFAYEGYCYIYAVVGETDNFSELLAEMCRLKVESTSGEHSHCRYGHSTCEDVLPTYTAFTGSTLSPDGSQGPHSYYLNAEKSTVNLALILRQLRGNSSENPSLDLCLYGKTLRADSEYAEQFRVFNKWDLSLTDCTGKGVLKGTSVDDEYGGCLYVADATVNISNIKVTGGRSTQSGGAIVVDAKGVLNIRGGVISGNTVRSGNGGAIYVKEGGVVNIYGGIIRDNQVLDGSGGAIYIAKGGTVNLFGGTITGNSASGQGGGIYVEEGGTLNVQGSPVVTGNTAGGKENNVYLLTNQRITITGNGLNNGAQIGVTSESKTYPVVLANAAQDASARFTADDENAVVVWLNNALALVQKPTVAVDDDKNTVTVSTGANYMPESVVLVVAEYAENGQLIRVHTETVQAEQGTYTYTVTAGARVRCFLLREGVYTPLTTAFAQIR